MLQAMTDGLFSIKYGKTTCSPEEIKIALYDQPTDKGLFVNQSSTGALEFIEWLPGHPQNPNFSYEVFLGLTNAKKGDRWMIMN